MACKIGLVFYAILQIIAFLLILVGTPIDMFRSKLQDSFGNTPCLTMWGYKQKCYSTTYDIRVNDFFSTCTGRRDRFRAAEAFAIICILMYGVAAVFGIIMFCCCRCLRWVCLVLNILGITCIVTWAIMADAYNSKSSDDGIISTFQCGKLKEWGWKYGAGFALFVTGWGLNVINIVFLMLPC